MQRDLDEVQKDLDEVETDFINIDSVKYVSLVQHKAITWTNDNFMNWPLIYTLSEIYKYFHSRKCIRKWNTLAIVHDKMNDGKR